MQLSCLNQERNMHRSSTLLEVKTCQRSSKQICLWILLWEEINFFTAANVYSKCLWIMVSYFGQKQQFKVKMHSWWIWVIQTHSFSLHKMLTGGLDWCGLLWINLLLLVWIIVKFYSKCSCLHSHSDGTHSLQKAYWWASGVMLNFLFAKKICSDEKN